MKLLSLLEGNPVKVRLMGATQVQMATSQRHFGGGE